MGPNGTTSISKIQLAPAGTSYPLTLYEEVNPPLKLILEDPVVLQVVVATSGVVRRRLVGRLWVKARLLTTKPLLELSMVWIRVTVCPVCTLLTGFPLSSTT